MAAQTDRTHTHTQSFFIRDTQACCTVLSANKVCVSHWGTKRSQFTLLTRSKMLLHKLQNKLNSSKVQIHAYWGKSKTAVKKEESKKKKKNNSLVKKYFWKGKFKMQALATVTLITLIIPLFITFNISALSTVRNLFLNAHYCIWIWMWITVCVSRWLANVWHYLGLIAGENCSFI